MQAPQLRSCAEPVAVVGASYQLPRPPQEEQEIEPEPPHIPQLSPDAPDGPPVGACGMEPMAFGMTFTRRRAVQATTLKLNALQIAITQPTITMPRKKLMAAIWRRLPSIGRPCFLRYQAIQVGIM